MNIQGKVGQLKLAAPLAVLFARLGPVWSNILVDVSKASGELVVAEAKATTLFKDSEHPERGSGGQLRASITTETYVTSKAITAVVWPGMEYGQYVHDGTIQGYKIPPKNAKPLDANDPRFIWPKDTQALKFYIGGVMFMRPWTRKGKRKPRPFLYKALEAKEKEIIQLFADSVSTLMKTIGA